MRSIVVTSLGLILALPGAALAQPMPQGSPQGLGAPLAPGMPMEGNDPRRPSESPMSAEARSALMGAGAKPPADLAPGNGVPPGQRPPRPEKAIGPDIASAIFAPIGVIVAPITQGLHAFDAAIAPINEVFQPLTGPYDAALVVGPDGARLAPEGGAVVAEPVPAEPIPANPPRPVRGPRK